MTQYRVSADIGGTFTDFVVQRSDGPVLVGKVLTTPDDPADGVLKGLRMQLATCPTSASSCTGRPSG